MLPKILLVTLGGTIAMSSDTGTGITPTLGADDLLAAVPAITKIASIETASPANIPSASLTIATVIEVARVLNEALAGIFDGAVVVQGTDTIEETAYLFDRIVDSDKPIVVTGAMRGAQAAGADGPANLLSAIAVAASSAAWGLGTLVVLNDAIHAARFVQKMSTFLPSAFQSPECGALGFVAEGQVHISTRIGRKAVIEISGAQKECPVALVVASLGDDGRLLTVIPKLGYKGAIVQGMGAGHVPAPQVPLLEALASQMPVVLCSRTASGPSFRATYGFVGSEMDLLKRGIISGGSTCALKARLLLSLLLSVQADRPMIEAAFS